MRISTVGTMIIGLGLAAVQPVLAANTNCDLSWAGTGVSAAPTDSGHLVAVRGTDGIIRVNEWKNSTQSWLGWMVLSGQNGIVSDPWVQYSNAGGQGIFARKNDSIVQWLGHRVGNLWTFSRGAFSTGGNGLTNRIASANGSTGSTPTVFFFATATDGTLKYQTWNGAWMLGWTDMGISNVVGSPYTHQVTANTINLYVRLSDGSLRVKYWNGSSWGAWLSSVEFTGIAEDPAAGTTTYQTLFSVSTAGSVVDQQWNGYNWTGWTTRTFPGIKSLSAVRNSSNQVMVYGIDANNNVWRATKTGTGPLTGDALVNCNLAP